MKHMITVKDILARPQFKKFHLVSGQRGLCNPVVSAGFFEWETGPAIEASFPKNEFVITTLSAAKDNPLDMEVALTRLIQCRVAAIAIKKVYFTQIPNTIYDLSNQHNIPILFFDNLYVDEVLFDLKTAIRENDAKYQRSIVNKLLSNPSSSPENQKKLALQLNPAFEQYLLFCAFISEESEDNTALERLDKAEDLLDSEQSEHSNSRINGLIQLKNYRYTILPYKGGTLCLCTAGELQLFNKLQVQCFLRSCSLPLKKHIIGISLQNAGLHTISKAIYEAIYANISCKIDHVPCLEFSETGIDRFLCPASESAWTKNYFMDLMERITPSEGAPDIFLKTLITYVKCGGNVVLTSKSMYQHSNTIRYRLSKIQELWNTQNDIDFDTQARLFSRLYYLYQFEKL